MKVRALAVAAAAGGLAIAAHATSSTEIAIPVRRDEAPRVVVFAQDEKKPHKRHSTLFSESDSRGYVKRVCARRAKNVAARKTRRQQRRQVRR